MSTYEISKSSLLSLKAEILRKQQELSKAKVENDVKIKTLKKSPLEIKNKGVEARDRNDQSDVDQDLLKQSRSVLEQKAALYEKLSSGDVSENDKERNKLFLVRFDKKNIENGNKVSDMPPSDSESDKKLESDDDNDFYQSDNEEHTDPGEKWVDYVDCFGRTRKCMQKDLEYLKSKDNEMKKVVEVKHQQLDNPASQNLENDDNFVQSSTESLAENEVGQSELLSSDMRRELLRQQWEKEEEELRNKSEIHYEDVLFGEARTHGVGYYRFSKDETERAKQQDALKKLRKETEDKQKKAQELKDTREKLLAARLKAARNRKRARMGLPPEEEEEEEPNIPTPVQPEIAKEELDKKKEDDEKEELLEQARKRHIRPWDIGKEGVKEHQILTQEEWVEKMREERPSEFAPPVNYRKNFRAEDTESMEQSSAEGNSLKFSTKKKSNIKSRGKMKQKTDQILIQETVTVTDDIVEASVTSDTVNYGAVYQDYEKAFKIHIENEVDSDGEDDLLRDYKTVMSNSNPYCDYSQEDTLLDNYRKNKNEHVNKRRAEIAPPSTYDYYGPSHSKTKKVTVNPPNIQDSIEQGLEFLRKQIEQKQKMSKNREDMFLC
ncbi:coiled-coil domain-containing protein 174 [Diabrotica virgifera virgifera]|uniref:Coiled-coil domain-containing protein 174 n=1 Tax=Diabrotica virgifera virgifera TaxID=50390 RepID=A0A6P7FNS0_DIAVI|nr:coiled-coil domain-containing protein 174 [Diabrotica virgifera virgifera]